MKQTFIIALILTAYSLTAQETAYNLIEFKNKTGNEIDYLFFSPGDSGWWGPDVLGDTRTMYAGESVSFYISYPEYSATFDFMAVDEEGNIYELYDKGIDDSGEARIVINKSHRTDQMSIDEFEDDLISLEIMNYTGFEIYYLFISPSDSDMYGIDFMDRETTLIPDDSVSVLLFHSEDGTEYDIMGEDLEGDTYSFSLTLDPELEFQYTEITLDDID